MNALLLAEHFRARFAADAVFAGRRCLNDQDSEDLVRPCLNFAAETKPISKSGRAFDFTLTVWVETSADPVPAPADRPEVSHELAVNLVRQKLFGIYGHADTEVISGAPLPRGAALRQALTDEGLYDIRGWSCGDSTPGLETHHFRTPVEIAGVAITL